MSSKITDGIVVDKPIKGITMEICQDMVIQGVEFLQLPATSDSYIVDKISRRKLIKLAGNENVYQFDGELGGQKGFLVYSSTSDVTSLYMVDTNTNEVTKVSHLSVRFGDYLTDSDILLYSESPESYRNILKTIQTVYPDLAKGLMLKVDGIYQLFLGLNIDSLFTEKKD